MFHGKVLKFVYKVEIATGILIAAFVIVRLFDIGFLEPWEDFHALFANVAAFLFLVVLVPGILLRFEVFPIQRRLLTIYRRALGVLMYLCGATHFLLLMGFIPTFQTEYEIEWNTLVVSGLIGFLILFPVYATSTNSAVRFFHRYWKWIQRLTYVALPFIAHHLWKVGETGLFLAYVFVGGLVILSYLVQWSRHGEYSKRKLFILWLIVFGGFLYGAFTYFRAWELKQIEAEMNRPVVVEEEPQLKKNGGEEELPLLEIRDGVYVSRQMYTPEDRSHEIDVYVDVYEENLRWVWIESENPSVITKDLETYAYSVSQNKRGVPLMDVQLDRGTGLESSIDVVGRALQDVLDNSLREVVGESGVRVLETQSIKQSELEDATFRDGTYLVRTEYLTHSDLLSEIIDTTITIKEDRIVDIVYVPEMTDETSEKNFLKFEADTKQVLIGRPLAEVRVDVISGSTDTSRALRVTLEQIKKEAGLANSL